MVIELYIIRFLVSGRAVSRCSTRRWLWRWMGAASATIGNILRRTCLCLPGPWQVRALSPLLTVLNYLDKMHCPLGNSSSSSCCSWVPCWRGDTGSSSSSSIGGAAAPCPSGSRGVTVTMARNKPKPYCLPPPGSALPQDYTTQGHDHITTAN